MAKTMPETIPHDRVFISFIGVILTQHDGNHAAAQLGWMSMVWMQLIATWKTPWEIE